MPVAPHAAVIPGRYYHIGKRNYQKKEESPTFEPSADRTRLIAYTEAINLLDYSAVVIPVTRADKYIDKFDDKYKPLNDLDRKNWKACKSSY